MTTGYRSIALPDPATGARSPLVVLYPADAPERAIRLGPYELSVALDAPVVGTGLPLVVVSHGSGGSHLVHRGLAADLARAGFVVAMPEHPGNNRNDNTLVDTLANLEHRPRLVRRVIDWAYADTALGPALALDRVAIVGHSMGGYTALAVAGGRPWAGAHETADGRPRAVDVEPDPRVHALVLLTPATPWYVPPDALRDVHVPILMLTGERDVHAPAFHGDVVRRGLPASTPLTHHVVPNAGHFAFHTPFPAAMATPSFAPAQDPPGFDRVAFQRTLGADVAAFLHRALAR